MATRLLLGIYNLEAGSFRVGVFQDSPITIGSELGNAIHVDDPAVSPQQGLLFFTAQTIKYLDYAPVSGGDPPVVVGLVPGMPFRVGPLELRARIEESDEAAVVFAEKRTGLAFLVDEMDIIFTSVALTSCAVVCGDARAKVDIARRAMQLLSIVAALGSELRRNDHALWMAPAELRPPILEPCDPLAITDYLLDPDGSTFRLDDFRQRFIDLARWESLTLAARGSA